jgi:ABC-2 type transport system ATP-binding protein
MTEVVLQIRGLRASYGKRQVLSGVDLSVARGEWFSLLGPNGSGKTTLLRCVSGQLNPAAGTVHIGGESIVTAPQRAKRLLGYAHAPDRLPGLLTGRQCLEVYAAARDLTAVGDDVLDLAERFQLRRHLDQFVDTYSLGTRQKLSALLALIGDPSLVVLDEAFNGLDPASALVLKRDLQDRVAAGRCAVLLATHALDVVLHYASAAALLLDGKLARGWDRNQLEAMRREAPEALELALAEAAATSASEY